LRLDETPIHIGEVGFNDAQWQNAIVVLAGRQLIPLHVADNKVSLRNTGLVTSVEPVSKAVTMIVLFNVNVISLFDHPCDLIFHPKLAVKLRSHMFLALMGL
jgi:hypothetical protein